MATEVIMPQLGESVVEGTVTKWLKGESDQINEFEPLVEINTDKVDTEVPAPASGTVLKLFVAEGETVKAGTLLAVIGEPGEAVPSAPPAAKSQGGEQPDTIRDPGLEAVSQAVTQATPAAKTVFISPVVARIAGEQGVDLSLVSGTGRGGRITKKDVLAYVERQETAAPWDEPASGELFRPTEEVFGDLKKASPEGGDDIQPLDAVRIQIADHMLRSKRTSPHVTTVMEADLGRVIAHRASHKPAFERDGVNLTFTAYFVAASVAALKEVPIVNSSWTDAGIRLHQQTNVGVAVSLGEKGLIVPVIKGADQMSLLAIARSVNDLAERARTRKLQPDDVHGGTFTITNHGTSGSLFATPIINQPQCAILGIGAIQKRAVVVEGTGPTGEASDAIVIRPMLYLTLTFDHRIIDGAIGDDFLAKVVERLQEWD